MPHWHVFGYSEASAGGFGLPKWSTKVLRTFCWCKTSSRVISIVPGPGAVGGIILAPRNIWMSDVFQDVDMKPNMWYFHIAWKSCIPTYHGDLVWQLQKSKKDSPCSCANGSSELVVLNKLFLHMGNYACLFVTKTEIGASYPKLPQPINNSSLRAIVSFTRPRSSETAVRCNWFPLRNHCLSHFGWKIDPCGSGSRHWGGTVNLVVFICLSTLTCETALVVLGLDCKSWEVVSVRWFAESTKP